jgi:hypothetical protein
MRKTLRQRLGYALALSLIAGGFSALAAAPAGARDTDTCTGSLNDFPAHVGVLSGIHAGNVQINGRAS